MAYLDVKIHYGQHKVGYSLCHNTDKIEGLKDELLRLGFHVSLVPVEYLNYCMLEMCGHQIFRCSIEDFQPKTQEDQQCQQAVRAVRDASELFLRADTYFWLWSLIDDQIFYRNECSARPVSPTNADVGENLEGAKCLCDDVQL